MLLIEHVGELEKTLVHERRRARDQGRACGFASTFRCGRRGRSTPAQTNRSLLLPPPLRTRLSQSSREVTCGRPCGYHACTSDIYPVTAQKGHGDMGNYTLPMSMTMLLESLTAVGFLALAFLSSVIGHWAGMPICRVVLSVAFIARCVALSGKLGAELSHCTNH